MTYMVINNLIVSSDIKAVHEYKPVLTVLIFIIGLISLKLIMDLYEVCPLQYKKIVGISIIIICSAMGGARIIFQLIQKNKNFR